jgi:small subunit ribosomal protein S5
LTLGPERHFEPSKNEVFDPNEFTLIFLDSDSVTNVTSLNRVNHRRVLIFVGNGNGLIGYGKGKGEDYESAFDNAFKKMR